MQDTEAGLRLVRRGGPLRHLVTLRRFVSHNQTVIVNPRNAASRCPQLWTVPWSEGDARRLDGGRPVSYRRYPRCGGTAPTGRLRPQSGTLPYTTFENAGLAHTRDGRIESARMTDPRMSQTAGLACRLRGGQDSSPASGNRRTCARGPARSEPATRSAPLIASRPLEYRCGNVRPATGLSGLVGFPLRGPGVGPIAVPPY